MTGIVYKVTNTKDGRVYIGITMESMDKRKQDHIQKARNNSKKSFHIDIFTFGEEAFIWEQIDTACSNNELADKEVNYIYEYKEQGRTYNNDRGGGISKIVYQYNLDGSLLESHQSLQKAGNMVDATKQQLSRACLSVNKRFGGFYWSYEYEDPFIPKYDNRKKFIIQYDMNYNELNSYNSIAEASKATECNKTSIAKVCRGERNHAGGFKWGYK